jgi:hypothetical protein
MNFCEDDDDNLSWYSEESERFTGFNEEEEDELVELGSQEIGTNASQTIKNKVVVEDSDDEYEYEEEVNSATFIMNQKSLVDKAPGALQHSFAHRTIPFPIPSKFVSFNSLQFLSYVS